MEFDSELSKVNHHFVNNFPMQNLFIFLINHISLGESLNSQSRLMIKNCYLSSELLSLIVHFPSASNFAGSSMHLLFVFFVPHAAQAPFAKCLKPNRCIIIHFFDVSVPNLQNEFRFILYFGFLGAKKATSGASETILL